MSVGVLGPGLVANDRGPTCRCPREVQTAAARRRQSPGNHRDGGGVVDCATCVHSTRGQRGSDAGSAARRPVVVAAAGEAEVGRSGDEGWRWHSGEHEHAATARF